MANLPARLKLLLFTADRTVVDVISAALDDAFDIRTLRHSSQLTNSPSTMPDIVLIDEEIAGVHTCSRLREAVGPHLPIVVVSSLTTANEIHRFFSAGANDVLPRSLLGIFSNTPGRLRPRISAFHVREQIRGRLVSVMHGANELRSAREKMRWLASARRLARIAQWELRLDTGAFRWSDEGTILFGLPHATTAEGISGLLRWVHPDDRMRVAYAMLDRTPHEIEYRLVLPNGRARTVHQETEVTTDRDGTATQLMGVVQDVTDFREAERQVLEFAFYDSLTRLPNRALLRRFLEKAGRQATLEQRSFAVIALDLDGFKLVNDTLGHAAGDLLLREVAGRLLESVHGFVPRTSTLKLEDQLAMDAMVARLGGDEFVIVLDRPEHAVHVAARISWLLATSFTLGKSEVFVSSSIGIASYPEHATDVDVLLERADVALYQAKECGRNNYQIFSAEFADKQRRRMAIESGLCAAMHRAGIGDRSPASGTGVPSVRAGVDNPATPELHLVYQPKIEVPSHRLVGVEALMRWTSPELGVVSPAEFIPVAEDTGLIVDLGRWALFTACSHAVSMAGDGFMKVAVNVSARQFREQDFVRSVSSILEQTGLPAHCLELELTENVVMRDLATSRKTLQELKALGVNIALDDFGTGYSSLNYLAKLPIDTLKIDRSFVGEIGKGEKAGMIASAIIALARGLAIDVVVEGVETQEQLAFVAKHAPVSIQGYFFAKPMSLAALTVWCPPPRRITRLSGVFRAA